MSPVGVVRVIGVEQVNTPHPLMVDCKIICEDEQGNRFYFQAAKFVAEMKPVTPLGPA